MMQSGLDGVTVCLQNGECKNVIVLSNSMVGSKGLCSSKGIPFERDTTVCF